MHFAAARPARPRLAAAGGAQSAARAVRPRRKAAALGAPEMARRRQEMGLRMGRVGVRRAKGRRRRGGAQEEWLGAGGWR